jgi:hypothetical protein
MSMTEEMHLFLIKHFHANALSSELDMSKGKYV